MKKYKRLKNQGDEIFNKLSIKFSSEFEKLKDLVGYDFREHTAKVLNDLAINLLSLARIHAEDKALLTSIFDLVLQEQIGMPDDLRKKLKKLYKMWDKSKKY